MRPDWKVDLLFLLDEPSSHQVVRPPHSKSPLDQLKHGSQSTAAARNLSASAGSERDIHFDAKVSVSLQGCHGRHGRKAPLSLQILSSFLRTSYLAVWSPWIASCGLQQKKRYFLRSTVEGWISSSAICSCRA